MGLRGPRPKSIPELRLAGTFRADRHAARANRPQLGGVPRMPRYLTGEAARMWKRIVPALTAAGVLAAVDQAVIVATYEAWELYRLAVEGAKVTPIDKHARMAAVAYSRFFHEGCRRLGLSPLDRSRLTAEKPAETTTATLADFARKRHAGE